MTFTEWNNATNQFFQKSRSAELKNIGTAFQAYETAPSAGTITTLDLAVAVWKRSKLKAAVGDEAGRNWSNSRFRDIVARLSTWVEAEMERHGALPAAELGWNIQHNCYAYAMKCDQPDNTGGHSGPGGAAGRAVSPSMNPYHANLIAGVMADGAAQNKPVLSLQRNAPSPVPAPRGGTYLVAMVAKADGFHFLRRNDTTLLWSHKNGPGSDPETYIYNNELEQNQIMTDGVVEDLLVNIQSPKYVSGFNSMTFVSYFQVPLSGIWVARNKGLPNLKRNYVTWA